MEFFSVWHMQNGDCEAAITTCTLYTCKALSNGCMFYPAFSLYLFMLFAGELMGEGILYVLIF